MAPATVLAVRSSNNASPIRGPVAGAVGISTSVGQGGANDRDDTQGVQTALNAVPAALGGASDALDVDGKVGPLTIGAIKTFQSRWLQPKFLDGRCDPAGPTLALLNAFAGVGEAAPSGGAAGAVVARRAGPRPPSPAEVQRIKDAELRQLIVDRHHMREVFRQLLVALRVNDAAQEHVKRLRALAAGAALPAAALTDDKRRAFMLVAKNFKLHERSPALAEAGVKRVDSIIRQSMLLVNSRIPPQPPFPAPPPIVNGPLFVSLFGQPTNGNLRTALAYTTEGGLHLVRGPRGSFNQFIVPGQVVPERNERIYLTPVFDTLSSDEQRLTLIHEMAHFVGPTHGHGGVEELGVIGDTAKWKALNSTKRLHTAESYAAFTTECGIGTSRLVSECRTTLDAIGEFPNVSAFTNGDPVISLPPAGNPHAAAFGFPGGFD